MIARHVRPKGQPRRSWAPLDPGLPRVLSLLDVPAPVLGEGEAVELRNRFGTDLWVDLRDEYGVSEALVRLAPRNRAARTVARGARRLLSLGLYTLAVCALIAVGPVLHGLGV